MFLCFRAFCAWEENLPVDVNAELAEQRLQHKYKAKLNRDGEIFPDPFSLTSGWKGEKKGIASWPRPPMGREKGSVEQKLTERKNFTP